MSTSRPLLRFARLAALLACAAVVAFAGPAAPHATSGIAAAAVAAAPPAYGIGRVVSERGYPEFDVDGKPFFMFGAAFFYERLPRESWAADMDAIRALGFNTLDLYVPWNWHELGDGDFDFDGRTNPRRDLREVLRLAKARGFYLIVRPGPVIRNEWRNGGYPQWLLERPEYGMPLRDVLEGRYPATATLQNARSDDAAAEWMRNATHVRYAERWLTRALHEFDPVADRVLAVALDDDQGAYIDNQTWPAPHLQAYLEALRGAVQGVTGPLVPTFVNTYQMKVTASSHVWAMGNWYQSDAYALGEHDRSQLEFSTGLIRTRPGQPTWTSEFQAGWLQQPQDVIPQPADPSNTILALGTMLQQGVTGVVDFPPQDSLAPAGYEAPFSNAFYAWDAALTYPEIERSPRYAPTREFGGIVRAYGPELAATHAAYDATIAWLPSAFPTGALTDADYGTLADRMLETQRACRLAGLACRTIDLAFASRADLRRSKLLLLPRPASGALAGRPFTPAVEASLLAASASGLPVASLVHESALAASVLRRIAREARIAPVLSDGTDATFAESDRLDGSGFLIVTNYGTEPLHRPASEVRSAGARTPLAALDVPARSTRVVPVRLPAVVATGDGDEGDRGRTAAEMRSGCGMFGPTNRALGLVDRDCVPLSHDSFLPGVRLRDAPLVGGSTGIARAFTADVERDGFPDAVLDNGIVRIVVSPNAGARAFVFEDVVRQSSAFDTVGALRDDVAVQPPLSTTDRIAKYTHQFPAGFFNRPYDVTIVQSGPRAVVRLSYAAPDAFPHGATFVRTLSLAPHSRDLVVDETADFPEGTMPEQHGVAISSLAVGDPRDPTTQRVLPEGTTFSAPLPDPSAPSSTNAPPGTNVLPGTNVPTEAAGLYDTTTHEAILVVSSGALHRRLVPAATPRTLVVTADVARSGTTRTVFRYDFPPDLASAQAELASLRRSPQAP